MITAETVVDRDGYGTEIAELVIKGKIGAGKVTIGGKEVSDDE